MAGRGRSLIAFTLRPARDQSPCTYQLFLENFRFSSSERHCWLRMVMTMATTTCQVVKRVRIARFAIFVCKSCPPSSGPRTRILPPTVCATCRTYTNAIFFEKFTRGKYPLFFVFLMLKIYFKSVCHIVRQSCVRKTSGQNKTQKSYIVGIRFIMYTVCKHVSANYEKNYRQKNLHVHHLHCISSVCSVVFFFLLVTTTHICLFFKTFHGYIAVF